MPVSLNRYRKGASLPKGVRHNPSGESKGGNGSKKNRNGSKKDEKAEQKKEDKIDELAPSSSFEQGAGQSQSEFSMEPTESPEQSVDMDTSEISLSSSFAASTLLVSSASDIFMATSISSPMMTELSEETVPLRDLGMRRQLEEPIDAGLEITSEMSDLTSELPSESIPESERSTEEAHLADIRMQHQSLTTELDLSTAVLETFIEDMETEELGTAEDIAQFQELLDANQDIDFSFLKFLLLLPNFAISPILITLSVILEPPPILLQLLNFLAFLFVFLSTWLFISVTLYFYIPLPLHLDPLLSLLPSLSILILLLDYESLSFSLM